jgi:GntR family transcriptional regulator
MAPLYSVIEQDLVQRIWRGELGHNEAIPTEQKLCEIYGVSRITVRRAVERLVAARMLYRRRGVGTFVNPREADGRSLHLTGHISDVLTFDRKLSARIVRRGPTAPPPAIRSAFGLKGSELLYAIEAVNSLDGKPYAVTRSFFPHSLASVAPKIRMRAGKTSIRYIEDLTGVQVNSGQQSIEATSAAAEIAAQLGIKPGTAILKAVRVYFADGPHPIEAVEVHYHPQRYRVRVELVTADSYFSPLQRGATAAPRARKSV